MPNFGIPRRASDNERRDLTAVSVRRGRFRVWLVLNVPLPADTPVPEVGKKMKCSQCGSRAVETKPELYPGGIEAMRRRS
jgi:hypothetical protein